MGDVLASQGRKASWLARAVGISKSHMSRLISGERTADPELAERIAAALQMPVFVLFVFTDRIESLRSEAAA